MATVKKKMLEPDPIVRIDIRAMELSSSSSGSILIHEEVVIFEEQFNAIRRLVEKRKDEDGKETGLLIAQTIADAIDQLTAE